MISVDGLAVEFGGTALFSDISFVINEKDRIALMGKNGAGKSTLLKILAGARQPTRGKVSAPKDCVVAYLPQHLMTEDGRTVFDETAQAFSHLHEMEAQIEKLNKELETRTDYESDSYMALIEEVSSLSEKFYSIDVTIVGLMVSLNRMEVGKGGEKCALDEIKDLYGFDTAAIVTMEEVVECLYNKECDGKVVIDDTLKEAIDAYYEQYGAK